MRREAEYALPERPYLIVVEPKKSATLEQHSTAGGAQYLDR